MKNEIEYVSAKDFEEVHGKGQGEYDGSEDDLRGHIEDPEEHEGRNWMEEKEV